MKVNKKSLVFSFIVISFLILTLYTNASALTVRMDPQNADIAPGNIVRIHFWADNSDALISMGIKVNYVETLLQAAAAAKYEDATNGWVMKDGASEYTTPAVNNADPDPQSGEYYVRMIGGHFDSAGTVGHNGSVLLGWIDFQGVAGQTGTSDITVSLAYDSTNFVHFVKLDGTPDEPSNLPSGGAVLGNIYVGNDACESDISGPTGVPDGLVNFADLDLMKSQFFTICSDLPPGQVCTADLDGDGLVNFSDLDLMKADFFRTCP